MRVFAPLLEVVWFAHYQLVLTEAHGFDCKQQSGTD